MDEKMDYFFPLSQHVQVFSGLASIELDVVKRLKPIQEFYNIKHTLRESPIYSDDSLYSDDIKTVIGYGHSLHIWSVHKKFAECHWLITINSKSDNVFKVKLEGFTFTGGYDYDELDRKIVEDANKSIDSIISTLVEATETFHKRYAHLLDK